MQGPNYIADMKWKLEQKVPLVCYIYLGLKFCKKLGFSLSSINEHLSTFK
jgi:hypothetical protein